MELVEVTSVEGLKLTGHYFLAERPKRTIILFHGWRGNWMCDFADEAKIFHENHINLLFVEQRAHGASEGKYFGFGVLERNDCMQWVSFVKEKEQEKYPVYLMGVSMGASTVLMASSREFATGISGIIADCGFTSPYEMIRLFAVKMLHLREHPVMERMDILCRRKAGYGLTDCSAKEAVRESEVPILFVHGTHDHFVPVQMGIANYDACKSKKQMLLVEGADHGKSFLVDTAKYLMELNTFFHWEIENI